MLNVLLIADLPYRDSDLYRGGVMQANHRLVTALSRVQDIRLAVLAPTASIRAVEERQCGNARIFFWPWIRRGGLRLYAGLRAAVQTLALDVHADLVHASHSPSYIFAALKAEIPSIITVHGILRNELPVEKRRPTLEDRLRSAVTMTVERYNFPRIKNLIAITSEIEAKVRAASPHVRVFQIKNAIDEAFFSLCDTQTSPAILFTGWVSHRKGVKVLIDAVRLVASKVPDVTVRIVGLPGPDPDYQPWLQAHNSDLIREGRVCFLGGVANDRLYDEMQRCAVFCLPSLAESGPMVIAQAMAAAKPVIATHVGGIPEMVEHNRTGLLVPPADAARLADALLELLLDKPRRAEMGKLARERARQRYLPESVAAKTVAAYRQVHAASIPLGHSVSGSRDHPPGDGELEYPSPQVPTDLYGA